MKKKSLMSLLSLGLCILLALIFTKCSSTKVGSTLEKEMVTQMINEHSFTFIAERMNPMRGKTRILTSSYDVRVNKDSLVSYLPYFGRAYSAPMDPSNVSTQFTSTDFSYEIQELKNTKWRVTLKPHDLSSIQEATFLIFENGSASLQLQLTTSEAISYTGHLKRIE